MALELPDYVIVAFNLIGLPWPGIDEDELRAWARGVRQFADDICDSSSQVNQTMRELADSSESSVIDAVAGEWERHHRLITEFREPAYAFADALNVAADAVYAQKLVIIGAATALAAEFTATQIGAIFTLGADEAAVPAEVISTRAIVKFALEELAGVIGGKLINFAAAEITDHLNRTISGMLTGTLQAGMEVQSLRLTPEAVTDVSRKLTGQAAKAEETGGRAHAENTSRNIEDNSWHGGWSEVIGALKQMLMEIAESLFKNLPATISKVLGDIAKFLLRFAEKVKAADEEGDVAVTADGPRARAPETGRTPGEETESPGGNGQPALAGTRDDPAAPGSAADRPTGGDPVDLATGEVLFTEIDVALPGVLPLVLERVHRSSRRSGRWFGRSWMSSLDQRLLVTGERVYGRFADGRVLTWTAPGDDSGSRAIPLAGPIWPLRRDPDGSYTVSDPQRGLTWRFEPRAGYETVAGADRELPLISVTDRVGHEIAFHYDAAGRPLSVTHSGGYRVLVSVTGGHVTGLTLAGRDGDDILLRRFAYDADGNLAGVINSSGLPMRFTYDDAGRLTSWTDRNGRSYRYTFDAEGRCVRGDGPGGALSGTFGYEPGITRWTDGAGAVTAYQITDSAELAAITDPLGNVTRFEHDSRGRVTTEIDPLGRITRHAYDDRGNLTAITRPDGSQATASYNDQCQPVLLTDPDGAVWRQEYDENGNRTLLEAPDGTVTRFSYDGLGHLTAVTAPDGTVTSFACDAIGLLAEMTGPGGARTCYETSAAGLVTRITGPGGDITRQDWTPEGKLASRTFPDGAAETWEWDGEGNLARHTGPAGAVTSYGYGPFGEVTDMRWPDGARSEFAYDHELHLVKTTHNGLTWRYTYDPAGRPTAETDYNGAVTTYQYDAAGQLMRQVNAAGQEITFGYDLLGNLTERTADGAVTAFEYDQARRLTSASNTDASLRVERDALGRVIAETCNGRTVTTSYDTAGRVTGRVTPSGAATGWELDETGRSAVMTAGGHRLRFGYDQADREIRRDLPGGVSLTQEWNERGQLTVQALAAPGRQLQRRDYRYRADGFPDRITDLLAGSRALTLDASGRVTSVIGTAWTEQYAYDQTGAITSAVSPAPPAGAADAWAGAHSRGSWRASGTLITHAGNIRYRHDAAGRVVTRTRSRISRRPATWRYTWDADSRLTAVTTPDGTTWQYRYDPFGRRIAKRRIDAAGRVMDETWFTWDGPVLAEQAEVADNHEQVTTWDYQPGTFTPLTQARRTLMGNAPQETIDQQFYAIVTDLAGMPAELINPDGTLAGRQQHTLWGTISWDPGGAATPHRFPGQYEDPETGLHYNNQRYYDPAAGIYLTPDPLGLAPAPNPHTYVRNPCIFTDPLGLQGTCRVATVVARHGGVSTDQGYRFPTRRAARQAASEIVGDLGSRPEAIRASEFRGGPYWMKNSDRIIGRRSFDNSAGWRDDFLGHNFGDGQSLGPHVNIWGPGIDDGVHLFY